MTEHEEEKSSSRKRKSRALMRAELLLFRAISAPLRHASDQRAERWSRRMARFLPTLIRRRHLVALRNLALVFPEKSEREREEILEKAWQHFAQTMFRFVRQSKLTGDEIAAQVYSSGRHHFVDSLARGKGLIIVTAHYGDWERGLPYLAQLDTELTVVARALDNELLDEDLYRSRKRANVHLVDRREAARPLLRTLQNRGTIAVLADQAVQAREGVKVPFLGLPAWTTPAPARFSLKFGAPIVCMFCEPRPDGRVEMIVEPPIIPEQLPPELQNVEALTAHVNEVLSKRIREKPELWLWMHDRWKNA